MRRKSPLAAWRAGHHMSREELAQAASVPLRHVQEAEEGTTGLAGELQDYLPAQV